MTFTVALSWPFIICFLGTLLVFAWWVAWLRQPSHGLYDLSGIFYIPMGMFFIALIWMIYFAFRVALMVSVIMDWDLYRILI